LRRADVLGSAPRGPAQVRCRAPPGLSCPLPTSTPPSIAPAASDPRVLLPCSRGAGKSRTASALTLHTALSRPGSLTLLVSRASPPSAGPGHPQGDERQAIDVFHYQIGAVVVLGQQAEVEDLHEVAAAVDRVAGGVVVGEQAGEDEGVAEQGGGGVLGQPSA